MGADLTVHDYWLEPNRFETVSAWAEARGTVFPENLIPPLAVMVKRSGVPVAFLAAYQAVGIGVAFADWAFTAPGQSLAQAKAATRAALEALKASLKAHGYGVLIAYAREPVSRVLLGSGGWVSGGEFIQLLTIIL
jgi:hypothetical protein